MRLLWHPRSTLISAPAWFRRAPVSGWICGSHTLFSWTCWHCAGIVFNNQMDDFSNPAASNYFHLAPNVNNFPQVCLLYPINEFFVLYIFLGISFAFLIAAWQAPLVFHVSIICVRQEGSPTSHRRGIGGANHHHGHGAGAGHSTYCTPGLFLCHVFASLIRMSNVSALSACCLLHVCYPGDT